MYEDGIAKSIPFDHRLSSLGKPHDASGQFFLSLILLMDSYLLRQSTTEACNINQTAEIIDVSDSITFSVLNDILQQYESSKNSIKSEA